MDHRGTLTLTSCPPRTPINLSRVPGHRASYTVRRASYWLAAWSASLSIGARRVVFIETTKEPGETSCLLRYYY